jgi:hypothetical protein
MATFADLTKQQQFEYSSLVLQHWTKVRRLVTSHISANTPEEKAAIQVQLDAQVALEWTVDKYLEQ